MELEEKQKNLICKCTNCGSTSLAKGNIGTSGGLQFNSEHSKILGRFGHYYINSLLCIDCGLIHMQALGNYKEELTGKV